MSSSICGSEASEPGTVCPSQAEQSKPSNARNENYGQCERSDRVSLAQTSQIKQTQHMLAEQIKQAKQNPSQTK